MKVEDNARRLIEQVVGNPAYDDLNNDQHRGVIEGLHKELKASLSKFDHEFILEELKPIKSKYTQAKLKDHLIKLATINCKPLKDFTATMMRRHSA